MFTSERAAREDDLAEHDDVQPDHCGRADPRKVAEEPTVREGTHLLQA